MPQIAVTQLKLKPHKMKPYMGQAQLPAKVHKAAIAIIPPLHLTHAIQRIRCFKDKSYVRWPPHINLLYPFLEDSSDTFATAAVKAAEAVAGIKPFKVMCAAMQATPTAAAAAGLLCLPHRAGGARVYVFLCPRSSS